MSRYSIVDLHESFITKTRKPSDVVAEMFATTHEKESDIHAYTSLFEEQAKEQAAKVDAKLDAGTEIGLLEGIPMSIKDIILIDGTTTTASSLMLENYTAVYDATVIKNLKEAGVIFTGKTNLDEFAMGSSTENSAFEATRNPHDTERVPGGSSGGSAASVAAGMAVASLGTDTGGSIRQPAALTGIVGMKPTYGRVSRFGVMAMASSLDQVGPFANTSLDAAYILKTIEGKDPMDATSMELTSEQELDFDRIKSGNVSNLTVGLPKEYFIDGIAPEIRSAIDEVIDLYKTLGVTFKEISLPYTKYAIPTYYILMPAEVSSNLSRFDGIRYGLSEFEKSEDLQQVYHESRTKGFGPESQRRIMLGSYVLSSGYYDAYYTKAKQVQALIRKEFEAAFQEVDAILTPTTPHTAFKIGEKVNDPVSMYLEDIFTVATNIAGIPGISLPTPHNSELPIGVQLMTKHFDENTLFTLGQALEQATR